MTVTIKTEKWDASVMPEEIKISSFTYTPAQAQKITALLGFAGSMCELQILPPQIEDPPFIVEFSEEGDLVLHAGDPNKSISFTFEDTDDLIVLINDMVNVSIDQHRLRPHARGRVHTTSLPGDGDIV